jgi:hypothetical protein
LVVAVRLESQTGASGARAPRQRRRARARARPGRGGCPSGRRLPALAAARPFRFAAVSRLVANQLQLSSRVACMAPRRTQHQQIDVSYAVHTPGSEGSANGTGPRGHKQAHPPRVAIAAPRPAPRGRSSAAAGCLFLSLFCRAVPPARRQAGGGAALYRAPVPLRAVDSTCRRGTQSPHHIVPEIVEVRQRHSHARPAKLGSFGNRSRG